VGGGLVTRAYFVRARVGRRGAVLSAVLMKVIASGVTQTFRIGV